jgi:hypothetical protein
MVLQFSPRSFDWPGAISPHITDAAGMGTEQQWQHWLERLYNLRRDKTGSR